MYIPILFFIINIHSKGVFNLDFTFLFLLINIILLGLLIWIISLIIIALLKYINSKNVKIEKTERKISLGKSLKEHRIKCKMTQEFIAERIGVSRQAVSKWENGKSDPSTANLITLAKIYNTSVEEILKGVNVD